MHLKDLDYLELPASADIHVHLRHGELMDLIVPQIRRGGVDTVFVCCVFMCVVLCVCVVCDGKKECHCGFNSMLTKLSPTFNRLLQQSLKLLHIDLNCKPLSRTSIILCLSTFI
jgi:hypothetical protein